MVKITFNSTLVLITSILFVVSFQNTTAQNRKFANIKGLDQGSTQYNEYNDGSIQPYRNNPWYWEHRGEPIMLVGASDNDNLFQWTGDLLIDKLNLIQSVGGNYVRNTMSDRDEGDTFAAKEVGGGLYDLDQWNEEYWDKLKFFLEETGKRGIIVHLTLWDSFDLGGGRFAVHPLNPENNINWKPGTISNSGDYYGRSLYTNNKPVLDYQHRFVDRIISISSNYNHIFYNIQNESHERVEWCNYWATYIKEAARKLGRNIHVTTMLIEPSKSVRRVMANRDIYTFAEVSQNNQDSRGPLTGKKHYENLVFWRRMIAMSGPMPINNVKVYGEGVGLNTSAGTEKEAIERFWRNIFGGAASTRFHRPATGYGAAEGSGWGIGISERAQQTLRAVNMFLDEFDIFSAEPYEAFQTVGNSVDVYCLADMGRAYAVYIPSGRATIHLDPWVHMERVSVKWLDIAELTWSEEVIIEPVWDNFDGAPWWGPQRIITLNPGGSRTYVAIVKVLD